MKQNIENLEGKFDAEISMTPTLTLAQIHPIHSCATDYYWDLNMDMTTGAYATDFCHVTEPWLQFFIHCCLGVFVHNEVT